MNKSSDTVQFIENYTIQIENHTIQIENYKIQMENYTIQMENIEYKEKLYNTNRKLYHTNRKLQNTNAKYRIQMEKYIYTIQMENYTILWRVERCYFRKSCDVYSIYWFRVRIGSPHPLGCRKRRLNGAVLQMRPGKPIKIPPCSKALIAEHRPKFCSPSPVMVICEIFLSGT
jgi:hypothetical protein